MIGSLLCAIGWHRPPSFICPREAISWVCVGCGRVQLGEAARKSMQRRK